MKTPKSVSTTLALILFLLVSAIPSEQAVAQWGVGASFETRDQDPTNGFGLRLERGILNSVPIVDVKLRAHFSFFSEEVENYRDAGVPAELDSYDFGLAAVGGVGLGLVAPYVGFGLGSESFEAVQQGAQQQSFEDSSLYWNVFTGASFTMLPYLKPFVEYRFTRMFSDEEFLYNQNGRWAIGITLEF